jgi:RNA polymerase sigma-70 factor (ECF subfamily)
MKYLKNEEDARDSVQQIFLKAINELHKYKVEYFKSWIYMIAKNHCLMKLRDKGKYSLEIKDNMAALADTAEDRNLLVQKDNTLNEMQQALKQLSTEQQQCITLFYLEKKSYTEIAALNGFTLLQVKSFIQNGKRNLRLMLEKKGYN